MDDFSDFFVNSHGITHKHIQNLNQLNILFLWRRDYLAHPRQTSSFRRTNSTIQRKIKNEQELFDAVKSTYPQHNVNGVQLDLFTMEDQLKVVGKNGDK